MRPLNFVVPVEQRQLPKMPLPPPPAIIIPVEEQGPLEYEVEGIIDDRTVSGEKQYLVRWKGYSQEHNSWQIAEDLVNSQETIDRYLRAKRKVNSKDNPIHGMFANARYPSTYPKPCLPAATVHDYTGTITEEIPGKPEGSLEDAIKSMVAQDADSFVHTDILYERLSVSFFKEKNWSKLGMPDQKSIQNKVRVAMKKAYPGIGKTERRGGRHDRRSVFAGLKFI